MAHSTQIAPIDFPPTGQALPFRSLEEQIEAIVAVLPEAVPAALKATVPSAREGTAEAIVADLIPRLRALCSLRPVRAQA